MRTSVRCSFAPARNCAVFADCVSSTRRSFTSGPRCQKYGALPTFQESSSSELNDLLSTIRSTILLPHYLNKDQKKLIFKEKYRSRLEDEPVYAQLGDEEIRLNHLDQLRDIPRKWHAFKRVVELSKEPRDYENFIPLLEGLHRSKIKVRVGWLEKMVRRANQAGMQHIVLRCLRQVESTGLSLSNESVLDKVMTGIRLKAANSEWDETATHQALRYAQQVLDLLEHPLHCGSREVTSQNPRTQPTVSGVVLELAAVRALRHLDRQDEGGKVALYAGRTIALWKQAVAMNKVEPPSHRSGANKYMIKWVPVWHGLALAKRVLRDQMPQAEAAEDAMKEIERNINAAAETIRSRSSEGRDPEIYSGMRMWRDVQDGK